MFDNRTALIIVGLLYLILPINAWLALRGQQSRALAWWCIAGLGSGLGTVLIGLRDMVPDVLSYIFGNMLLLASLLIRARVLDEDLDKRLRLRWLVLALLSFALVYGLFHFNQDTQARSLTGLVGVGLAASLVGVLALQIARRENSANARAIALVFLLLAGMLCFRMLTAGGLNPSAPLDRTLSATLVSLAGLLSSITGHFSYVGLVLDRSLRTAVEHAAGQARKEQNHHLAEQLEQLDRLRSLGLMSATLGHELNQPLTAILTNAQVAQRAVIAGQNDRPLIGSLFEQITSATQRARLIIEGLSSFRQAPRSGAVDVDGLLRSLPELTEQEARQHGVTVSYVPPRVPLLVRGEVVQLSQVLLNVMRNAIEGLKSSPRREIRIGCEACDQQVRITIHDSGPGLAPEVLARIGTPFFTTKPDGLGMGLSISHAILARCGGSLSLSNAPTGGAMVEIGLPLWTDTEKSDVTDA